MTNASDMRADAPGRLAVVESFCNSAVLLRGEDALATTGAATEWLRAARPGAGRVDARQRVRLVAVREAVRDFLDTDTDGPDTDTGTAGEGILALLNAEAAATLAAPHWTPGRPARLRVRARSGAAAFLGEVLASLFTAELTGELTRLRPCRAADCRWVFYDRSRAGNGVWCSMQTCGARHKMRAYRRRRAFSVPPALPE